MTQNEIEDAIRNLGHEQRKNPKKNQERGFKKKMGARQIKRIKRAARVRAKQIKASADAKEGS